MCEQGRWLTERIDRQQAGVRRQGHLALSRRPRDAANDLAAGVADWWELPPLDFIPKIEQNPDLQTFVTDPLGMQGWLRPNCLPPVQ